MSGFPDVKFVSKNNIGIVCVVYVLEESDFHFSHGGSPTGTSFILDIKTVPIDGVLGSQDNLNNELPDVLLFDWDVIEEYGGRLERKIIVGDKVDDLLGELSVFDSIGT